MGLVDHVSASQMKTIMGGSMPTHELAIIVSNSSNINSSDFELALVALEEEPPVEHLSPTWLKGLDNFSDSRESLNTISRECLEEAKSSIVINLMSWYKKPEDKYSQGDKSQLEPLGRVEDGPSTGPVESGHGCLTSADIATSLPASKPGLSAEGTIGPCTPNCLATLDNGTSENRTNFVLTIDGVSTCLLLDTGAEKSYASESYTKRRRVALSNNPDRPLVNGVWGKPLECNKQASMKFNLSGLDFSHLCHVAPLTNYDIILGMDWISEYVIITDWATGDWMLKDKHGKQAKFNPLSVPSPKVRVHTINGVAEMDPENVPITHSQMRRLMRKKGTVSFAVHVQEHLNLVSKTTGPREDVPPELPKVASQDL
ncbi:hypothetical protein CROQUDRAFT_130819 [Cronartium quercuum f. sp. fusiforme G11]|uniref:Uncharacterized protein n=1 Tax=Cronartium quercuum f. sp. fusiforme G11 TaxID=708437 RepID=A0A9P6NVE3_9BASI|nr:hypothetical protein CROQUDRAFT_130819 [Cronartium quercuum f. sp. fusiforme G11]